MAYAFGTSGAVPNSAGNLPTPGNSAGNLGTPQARALNTASSPQIGPSSLALLQSAGVPKSQTITAADGSSHTMNYQPPVDTSSFTPAQLAAFQSAASLGSGVQTTSGMIGGQGSAAPSTNYGTSSQTDPNAGSNPSGSAATGANAGLIGGGAALTTAQMAAANTTGTGQGSPDPTANQSTPVTVLPGSLGTGTPAGIAANQTASGYLGNLVGQSQATLQQQQSIAQSAVQNNMATIQQATQEEEELTGGSYQGTAADYSGRLAQLENIKQSAQANVNQAEQNLATFSAQAQSALSTGETQATTGANVTAPAGEVTTNSLTGAQYSNPALAPVGTQAFYSPQPNGTPNGAGGTQAPTAGQAQQYTIQSGDTFDALAAKYGTTAAALEAANPGVNPTDMQIGSKITIPAAQSNNPFTGGVAQGEAAAGSNLVQMQQGLAKAQSFASGLQQFLSDPANANINFSQIAPLNAIQQWVQNGVVPQGNYQTFFNYLNEYTNALAPVLGVGGDSTNLKTAIAQSFVNPQASPASIEQVIENMNTQAQNAIAQMAAAGQNPGSSINPPTATAPTSEGTQTYTGTSGTNYNVSYVNGQWVVQ